MARRSGQSASPTARPRKAKDTSVTGTPGSKKGPTKSSTAVAGRTGRTGHK